MLKIAINGFGRIGRAAFRLALTKKNLEVVAINDLGDINNLAYLLKHDTVYGQYDKEVVVSENNLVIAGKSFPVLAIKEPSELPWKKFGVDVVIESTGFFTKKEDAEKHIKAGAKKVLISALGKGKGIETVVRGVNEEKVSGSNLIANASCTTNCVAPVMAVLESEFGVEKALLSTIHALTISQRTVDSPNAKDWREGRAAGSNIIPTATGAAVVTAIVLPELKDKFDGISLRVPMAAGSISDIVAVLKRNVTADEVNNAFKKAAKLPRYKGILAASDEELVSSDIIGTSYSAIVDLKLTRVIGGNLVKVLAWYDNEWGYANRLVEMAEYVGRKP